MPKKDFLDQFSTNNVPDSFKKEDYSLLLMIAFLVILMMFYVFTFPKFQINIPLNLSE